MKYPCAPHESALGWMARRERRAYPQRSVRSEQRGQTAQSALARRVALQCGAHGYFNRLLRRRLAENRLDVPGGRLWHLYVRRRGTPALLNWFQPDTPCFADKITPYSDSHGMDNLLTRVTIGGTTSSVRHIYDEQWNVLCDIDASSGAVHSPAKSDTRPRAVRAGTCSRRNSLSVFLTIIN